MEIGRLLPWENVSLAGEISCVIIAKQFTFIPIVFAAFSRLR